jgi:hypothetical protein
MLRHFARNIRGSDNFWRSKTEDLKHWITHHIAPGNGPPKFFITLSCAENWWPDLKRLLGQLDENAKNYPRAEGVVHANVGQNVTPHNPFLGLFLFHFLPSMVLRHHESIHNNTNNKQTQPPW